MTDCNCACQNNSKWPLMVFVILYISIFIIWLIRNKYMGTRKGDDKFRSIMCRGLSSVHKDTQNKASLQTLHSLYKYVRSNSNKDELMQKSVGWVEWWERPLDYDTCGGKVADVLSRGIRMNHVGIRVKTGDLAKAYLLHKGEGKNYNPKGITIEPASDMKKLNLSWEQDMKKGTKRVHNSKIIDYVDACRGEYDKFRNNCLQNAQQMWDLE